MTSRFRSTQAHARERVVESLRLLEMRIEQALNGTKMRGLPNLNPDGREPFNAVRLRGRFGDALPADGRAVLVLRDDGKLVMAMRDDDKTLRPRAMVTSWEAHDGDLLAEDMESVIERTHQALTTHLARIDRSAARYVHAHDLAARLANALF